MRGLVTAAACLGLLSAGAQAGMLQLFFAPFDQVGEVLAGQVPTPVVAGSTPVYLWAITEQPDIWQGIGLRFALPDLEAAPIEQGLMFNPSFWWSSRWSLGSDFDLGPGDNTVGLVAVYEVGLGSPGDTWGVDCDGTFCYYVGEMAFAPSDQPYAVHMQITSLGIGRRGTDEADPVAFGFGDDALYGDQFWAISDTADLRVESPEPSSLLLLVWGALGLRRR